MAATTRTLTALTLTALLLGLAGCSVGSDPLAPAAPLPTPDTAPPATPVGLVATPTADSVKLRWEANTVDADLAGYRVYELAFGGANMLVEQPLQQTWWVDTSPPTNPCQYAVTAVDASGNESAWQTVAYAGAAIPPQRDDAP